MTPQLKASDPSKNIWVAASAGTGKTKTLIDRILRLLLQGEDPSHIVCLTYTRTGAAQMKTRLHEKLALWAGLDDQSLSDQIQALDETVHPEKLQLSKNLLCQYLWENKSVKIQTLHAFCEEFLQKYVLEAGLSPFFEIMDETQEEALYGEAFTNLIENSKNFSPFLPYLSLRSLQDLLEEFISLEQRDGVFPQSPNYKEDTPQEFVLTLSTEDLDILKNSPKDKDQKLFRDLQNPALFANIFLTQSGEMRKKICSVSMPAHLQERLEEEQLGFFEHHEHQKTQTLFYMSKTLHTLALEFQSELQKIKFKKNLYTFSDIIILSLKILTEAPQKHPWVLMTLFNTLSHLLIDEAQDTSPVQWKFLEKLIEVMFDGAPLKPRSLFVVGDFKQSIFSFQGANPEVFVSVCESISKYLQQQNTTLEKVDLNTSFRSSREVLEFVDGAFEHHLQTGVWETEKLVHNVSREDLGKVEILPPCPTPVMAALEIQKRASNDTLILFRRRSAYVKEALREVEKLGLPTSGLDRFNLLEDFAILDLLALARVCTNPLDDMAVALTLLSPLFRWSDQDLGYAPLFAKESIQPLLQPLIEKSQKSSVLEFFVWLLIENEKRDVFIESYGENCRVVFEYFFREIRNFEAQNPSTLDLFLPWINFRKLDVKRDATKGSIACMSIHGSKGMEAETVILLEADSAPKLQDRLFLYKNTVFWTPQKELWPESFKALRSHHKDKIYSEYNRLLYVALTRARDHLYIFATQEGGELSWYKGLQRRKE